MQLWHRSLLVAGNTTTQPKQGTCLYGGNPSQNLRQMRRKLCQKRFMKSVTGSRAAKLQNLQK